MTGWRALESEEIRRTRHLRGVFAWTAVPVSLLTPLIAGLFGTGGWWLFAPAFILLVMAGMCNVRINALEERDRVRIALDELREEQEHGSMELLSDDEREIRARIAEAESNREEAGESIRQRLNTPFFLRGIRLGHGDHGVSELQQREKDDIAARDAAIAELAEIERRSGED
jgi:hypothetical protein